MTGIIITLAVIAAVVIVVVAEHLSRADVLDDVRHDFAGQDTQARVAQIHRAWVYVALFVGVAMLLLGLWGGHVLAGSVCEVQRG